ncbi:MAG: Retroviral aspartyl protease [SAR202 cluster bacterium]|nr:Retroviral aspartyl protease [SAR202 cluster bacterium]
MLVDTGATFSLVPRQYLQELGIEVVREVRFRLADESTVSMPVGRVLMRLDGLEEVVPVVFGPNNATPLLGAIAMEAFLLAPDPVNQRLVPVDGLLK